MPHVFITKRRFFLEPWTWMRPEFWRPHKGCADWRFNFGPFCLCVNK